MVTRVRETKREADLSDLSETVWKTFREAYQIHQINPLLLIPK